MNRAYVICYHHNLIEIRSDGENIKNFLRFFYLI